MKPEKTHRKKASTVRRCPPRRIPKSVLTRTIEILDDSSDEFWLNKNSSCAPPINYEASLEEKHSDTYKKLNLARNCLLTRDWQNLAKLLTSNLFGSTVVQKCSIPIFSEYASITLTLLDPELLTKLHQAMQAAAPQATKNLKANVTQTE